MVSLGFSVQAEHAHQNQGRLYRYVCWIKEQISITNTAGVFYIIKSGKAGQGQILYKTMYRNAFILFARY